MSAGPPEEQFRRLFVQEARDRLDRLSEQLLALEGSGRTAEVVGSLFREAHNLKGGAAVVGFAEIGRVAHAMEEILDQLRTGARAPSEELVDGLLAATDALRELVDASLEGTDLTTQATGVVADLLRAAGERDAVPEDAPSGVAALDGAAAGAGAGEPETVRVALARLDELVRLVTEAGAAALRLGRVLGERLGAEATTLPEYRDVSRLLGDLQQRAMRVRMVPVATLTPALHRATRDLARAQGKVVRWEVEGGDTELDRGVLQLLEDPLLQIVRNAVVHGAEPPAEREAAAKTAHATIRLRALQLGPEAVIAVADDGRGIDLDAVRTAARARGTDAAGLPDEEALYLIFGSGLTTAAEVSNVAGRGVGLDVVRAALERVRGRVEVRSEPGRGAEFRLIVPITLAVVPCLLVEADGRRYALPLHAVVTALPVPAGPAPSAGGGPVVNLDGRPVALSGLGTILRTGDGKGGGAVVVVAGLTRVHALRVDALLGQRDVVVQGLSELLPRLDVLTGASVEPDGSVLLVLDVAALIERARRRRGRPADAAARGNGDAGPAAAAGADSVPPRILVVDDALTVRELQRSILQRAGYRVLTAADGAEALGLLAEEATDLVLTDIEMPRMDGFALCEAIRSRPGLAGLPIVILTTRTSEEDRHRGLEAGADAYIVKSRFDAEALLATVGRLLGVTATPQGGDRPGPGRAAR